MTKCSREFAVDELSAAIVSHLQLSKLPAPAATGGGGGGGKPAKQNNKKKQQNQKDGKKKQQHQRQIDPQQPAKRAAYDRWTLRDEKTVDYGYLGSADKSSAKTSPDGGGGGYYITTAINYTNGPAHMGHAYEAATTDVIARYHRLVATSSSGAGGPAGGTYFVTGTDEHGQKIATAAADQSKQPIEICDLYAKGFQVLNQRILISNDDFIRTTSDRHKRTARALWKACHATEGDIYLDTYSGWYNVREETFVTDNDAELSQFKDPVSGVPLKKVEEESYFFKMSKYQARLIEHIESHPEFIQPEQHRNQILTRLRQDELRDLSISRTTFHWGIRVPDGFDQKHVMYVWMDALSNYLTGVDYFGTEKAGDALAKFWPADVHIIGKDILWFHTVIWPCLLMSAGIPLPTTVFAHGFVNDKEGKKMSKSLGNVIDPHDMLDRFDVDTFRWYLCKEAPYGGELSFSEPSMRDMHNADLCGTLGNLIHRATNLCQKDCGGAVPDVPPPATLPVNCSEVYTSYCERMAKFDLQGGAAVAIQAFRDVNGYLQTEAPWLKKGDEHEQDRQIVVRATLEAIYFLTHLLLPFIPHGASTIFRKLNTEPMVPLMPAGTTSSQLLKVGTKIEIGDILYTRSQSEEEIADAAAAAAAKKESYAEAQRRKKEAKAQMIATSKKGQQAAGDPNQPDFTKLDIRVGKIGKVWNHPDADKLYCEEIDVGEADGAREIASGLRPFYTLEQMENRKVLVVCNLKPAKIVGFMSNGMVLAAKSKGDDGSEKVEFVEPPADAEIGERVYIDDIASGEPFTSTQVKKKKIMEVVAKELKTNDDCVATWQNKAIRTKAGPCKSSTLTNAGIS